MNRVLSLVLGTLFTVVKFKEIFEDAISTPIV